MGIFAEIWVPGSLYHSLPWMSIVTGVLSGAHWGLKGWLFALFFVGYGCWVLKNRLFD